MTPLLAALSRLCDAVRIATVAASTSPASAASRNLRTEVFSEDLTALFRCRAFSFCLLRLIWDLIFATRKPRSGSGSRRWARADFAPAAAPRTPGGAQHSDEEGYPNPGAALKPAAHPAVSAGAAAGDDGPDGHLQGVTRVRAFPLHLRVGLRDGGECAGDPVRRPAAQLLPHLVDAPWRGTHFRGERGGGLRARRGPDPPDQPDPLREGAGDQYRRHPHGQGPAQVLEGLGEVSLDRLVGHGEPAGFGAAAVVPGHHGLVDDAGGVRGELGAGGGELAQVGAERVDERPDAGIVDPAPLGAELLADERHPVADPGELRVRGDLSAVPGQPG